MIPEHYARDIVERCSTLIDSLMPAVLEDPGDTFGGSLSTTFLLAMSTPMVLLPIERMLKPANRDAVADDRVVDEALGAAVNKALCSTARFGSAPFAVSGGWSYVAKHPPFNLAKGLPDELLDQLASEEATTAANDAMAPRVLTDLRNALAHGGVAYLDENGRRTDSRAAMLAFVSAVMRRGQITSFNVLRVSENDYRRFLGDWAVWLREAGVAAALGDRAA